MIDALISDIQNPGKGTAGPLSYLRDAEFTPSNSPDSFAAYLERISGSRASWSAVERSAAETDFQAVKRDVQRNIRNGEDKAAQNDTQKAVGEDENPRPAGAAEKRTESSPQSSDEHSRPDEAAQSRDQAKSQDASRDASDSEEGNQSEVDKAKTDTAEEVQKKGDTEAAEKNEKAAAEEQGKNRAAQRADTEKTATRALKTDSKADDENEESAANIKIGQKQQAAADQELQAQQAVQRQTDVETAVKNNRTAEAESSKKVSLQKGADEKRDSATARDLRNRRSGESEGRPKLTVVDRRGVSARSGNRTGQHSGNGNGNGNGADGRAGFNTAPNANNGAGMNAGGATRAGNGEGEGLQIMQVHLQGEGSQPGSPAQTAGRSGDTGIRGQLIQQLQDHLNKDIVKRSSILIRENGAGEIKLDLKPDNLGQVRIRITMENNHIAGKIFVENSSVKEAFDQNMQQLYRAFKEHGFEDAALNVSVGDQGREQQQRGRSHGPQPRVASQQLHTLDQQSSTDSENSGELRLVDVMA